MMIQDPKNMSLMTKALQDNEFGCSHQPPATVSTFGLIPALRMAKISGKKFYRVSKPEHKYEFHELATFSYEELMAEDYCIQIERKTTIGECKFREILDSWIFKYGWTPPGVADIEKLLQQLGFK